MHEGRSAVGVERPLVGLVDVALHDALLPLAAKAPRCPLPTARCPLPTTRYLLPTNSLPGTCLQPTAHLRLTATSHLTPTTHPVPPSTHDLTPITYHAPTPTQAAVLREEWNVVIDRCLGFVELVAKHVQDSVAEALRNV